MAFLKHLPAKEIALRYTHVGLFCGLVPVYVGDLHTDCPCLDTRNWVPDWAFDVVAALFGAFCWVAESLDPSFEAAFPIVITGEIVTVEVH